MSATFMKLPFGCFHHFCLQTISTSQQNQPQTSNHPLIRHPMQLCFFFRKIRKKTPTPTKFFMMSSPKFLGGFMIHFDFDYYFFSMGWVGKQPPTSRRSPEKRPKEDQGQPLSVSIRHDLPLMVAADLIHGFGSQ